MLDQLAGVASVLAHGHVHEHVRAVLLSPDDAHFGIPGVVVMVQAVPNVTYAETVLPRDKDRNP